MGYLVVFLKANASSSFTEKTQSRQHGQQEEDNRYRVCAC